VTSTRSPWMIGRATRDGVWHTVGSMGPRIGRWTTECDRYVVTYDPADRITTLRPRPVWSASSARICSRCLDRVARRVKAQQDTLDALRALDAAARD
jgi:hypothetical protein